MRSGTAKYARGFTLLEVLIVIGLFAVVAGLVLTIGLHTHSGFTTKDDEDLVLATLQKVRNQSMNGVCVGSSCVGATAHGVHVNSHSLVLFQGTTYDPADIANESINAESAVTTFTGSDIIFAPLSGNTTGTSTLTILDNGVVAAVVTVEQEGQITWSQ